MGWIFRLLLLVAAGVAGYGGLRRLRRRSQTLPDMPDPQALITPPDEAFSAWRTGDHSVQLRWRSHTHKPTAVYAGSSPETIDYSTPLATIDREETIAVTVPDENVRYFFALTFEDEHRLITTERTLPLLSIPNLRDAGGYLTESGKQVRWNRVYRAAYPGNITPQDSASLQQMGVKLVCDLRSDEEALENPDRLPETVGYLHLPVEDRRNPWARFFQMMIQRTTIADYMITMYTQITLEEHAHVFGTILQRIADEDQLPLMIHCSAGKDRTGIATALLLGLLGVSDDIILADYSLSNHWYDYFREISVPYIARLSRFGFTENDLQPAIIADVNNLRATLAYLQRTYGSIETYLKSRAGLTDETIQRIRANMLTDTPVTA